MMPFVTDTLRAKPFDSATGLWWRARPRYSWLGSMCKRRLMCVVWDLPEVQASALKQLTVLGSSIITITLTPRVSWRGANKGDGIAARIAGLECGRGPLLTGWWWWQRP